MIEKEKLFCLSIKDYIESRKCIENNYNMGKNDTLLVDNDYENYMIGAYHNNKEEVKFRENRIDV